jgi:hypothetical protein
MPLEELLTHLDATDDAIASYHQPNRHGHDGEILTKRGYRYVTSTEGQLYDGRAWFPKIRWNRF